MRIAVLGNGSIGKRHLRNLKNLGHKELVGMDPSAPVREQVKSMFPDVVQFDDIDSVFHTDKPDIVFVCSPPQHHLSQLDMAVENDCHVYVEKPFTLNTKGVEEVLQKADQKGLKIMTGFNMRYVEPIRKMKQWLDDGQIGHLLSCRIALSSYMPNWHPWEDYRECFMAYWKSGGGALFDYVHGIDIAQWFAGDLKQLSCIMKTTSLEMETDDMAILYGLTDQGVMLDLYFDFVDRQSRRRIELIGTKGTALWELSAQHKISLYDAEKDESSVVESRFDWDSCYVEAVKNFFLAIDQNNALESDGWNGLKTQKVLEMAMESNQSGTRVSC